MATELQAEVRGLKELHSVFEQLPDRLRTNVLRGAVRAGSVVLQRYAAQQARIATAADYARGDKGRLAASIELARRSSRAGDWMSGGVRVASRRYVEVRRTRKGGHRGVVYNPARIWHFFEFGTAERVQRRGKRRTGFIAARPFFRPTIRTKGSEALLAMSDYIRKRIDRELHRLAASVIVARGGL